MSNKISEGTKKGLARARAKGVKLGTPRQIDHREVLMLRAEGHAIHSIAKILGASQAAVGKILARAKKMILTGKFE